MTTKLLPIVGLLGFSIGLVLSKAYNTNETIETPILQAYNQPEIVITSTPTPTEIPRRTFKGFVSHYSVAGCLGCRTDRLMRNGEKLDDSKATIAFNKLPMNTMVKITNTDNGKSIVAKVTDTGGFERHNRIADLTPAVYEYLETKTDKSIVIIEEISL